ncbi:unnamed protein product [Rhizophagus irregularis]|uniref:Uncharacterized protein n=1 Tax=Rhizophagus irregularis TaxID=588596 RepID=A0A915ZUB0_9GLOM|nr:unnamed protein product [Rhizophagus irregularis]CAB5387460.1 unnamed protein product [Rhizophagus irregularis]
MILNIILSVICGLIIIGCIFIFFRVSKIRAHLNEKRLSLGIKFPFYLAITYYFLAILNACLTNLDTLCILCGIESYFIGKIVDIFLTMNLFLGTILTLQTWIILKNNYEITYVLIPISFYCLLMIHMKLKLSSLDKTTNYKFNVYDLKKLRSYIFLFVCQWVLIITFRFSLSYSSYRSLVYTLSYLIGGIFHVILFIKNEGFLFNPDTIVRQEKAQQINDPETGIISPVENGQEYSLTETVSE